MTDEGQKGKKSSVYIVTIKIFNNFNMMTKDNKVSIFNFNDNNVIYSRYNIHIYTSPMFILRSNISQFI